MKYVLRVPMNLQQKTKRQNPVLRISLSFPVQYHLFFINILITFVFLFHFKIINLKLVCAFNPALLNESVCIENENKLKVVSFVSTEVLNYDGLKLCIDCSIAMYFNS